MKQLEITFIEDPEIAAAIGELKSRWPAVGEAADHPLTEWFCQQFLAGRKFKKLRNPFDEVGNAEQWTHFAGVPLQFREIAGILVGFVYFRETKRRWINNALALIATVFIWGAFCGLSITTGDHYPYPETLRHWTVPRWILFSASQFVAVLSMFLSITGKQFLFINIFFRMNGTMKTALAVPMWYLYLILTLLTSSSTVVILETTKTLDTSLALIWSLTVAIINTAVLFYFSRLNLDRQFLKLVERNSEKYSEYVRKHIQLK